MNTLDKYLTDARYQMKNHILPEVKSTGLSNVTSPAFSTHGEAVAVATYSKNYLGSLGIHTKQIHYSILKGKVTFGFVAYSRKYKERSIIIRRWQARGITCFKWLSVGAVIGIVWATL